jgi:hypothetical protein
MSVVSPGWPPYEDYKLIMFVPNHTVLKNKSVFSLPVMWFIFNLRRKKTFQTQIYYNKRYLTSSFCAMLLNMILLKLLAMWLMLVQTGPLRSHAQRYLQMPSLGSAWLGLPKFQYWGSWPQFRFWVTFIYKWNMIS